MCEYTPKESIKALRVCNDNRTYKDCKECPIYQRHGQSYREDCRRIELIAAQQLENAMQEAVQARQERDKLAAELKEARSTVVHLSYENDALKEVQPNE